MQIGRAPLPVAGLFPSASQRASVSLSFPLQTAPKEELALKNKPSSSHGLVQQEFRVVFHEDGLVCFLQLDAAPVDF